MTNSNNHFIKLWGMPIWMATATCMGLVLAILGTGIWHILSWIALTLPVYIMVKYGRKFFTKKKSSQSPERTHQRSFTFNIRQ